MFTPLTIHEFFSRTGLDVDRFSPLSEKVEIITSLREMASIECVTVMRGSYLNTLMGSVSLTGDSTARPYQGCKISRMRVDPRVLLVGQTFIENRKLLALIDFADIFKGHDVPFGISKKGSYLIYGRDRIGRVALAHYLPPIIEWADGDHRLLDGLHRCSHTMASGTTIEVLMIHDVSALFPCDTRTWKSVKRVDVKPPKDKRFFGLHKELFRDLKAIGIDG